MPSDSCSRATLRGAATRTTCSSARDRSTSRKRGGELPCPSLLEEVCEVQHAFGPIESPHAGFDFPGGGRRWKRGEETHSGAGCVRAPAVGGVFQRRWPAGAGGSGGVDVVGRVSTASATRGGRVMSSAAARDRAVGCVIVALVGIWAVGSSPLFRFIPDK